MKRTTIVSALALGMASLAFAQSAEPPKVMPGNPAPATDFSGWVKGVPVYSFEPGKTYVVEFWATWCGPCIQSIPHITKLQKENPDVTFIGFAVWENESETKTIDANVRQFVAKFGEKMDYRVAIDTADGFMAENWMLAAEQNGIPASFIVHDRKVAWVGHPMNLDAPLAAIINGTHDLEAAKRDFMEGVNETREAAANAALLETLRQTYEEGKKEEAIAGLKKLAAEKPMLKQEATVTLLDLLLQDNRPEFDKQIDSMMAEGEAGQAAIANFAFMQANIGDKALPASLANRVFQATSSPIALYFAGLACEGCEDFKGSKMAYEKAIEKAIAVFGDPADGPNPLLDMLKERLATVSAKINE